MSQGVAHGPAALPVIGGLAYALVAVGLLVGGWAGVVAYLDKPTDDPLMVAAIVLEVGLLAQTGIAVSRLVGAHVAEPVTFVAYAVGVLLPLPLGFYLARIERTRWGSMTLGFTAVVVAVMTLRLLQIWRSDLV
ncbi:MAG: hypothetical protein ACR2M5_12780 [Nakamurella sp.]